MDAGTGGVEGGVAGAGAGVGKEAFEGLACGPDFEATSPDARFSRASFRFRRAARPLFDPTLVRCMWAFRLFSAGTG